MARILVHWKPPPEGLIKLNVDGSFLADGFRLGAGGILRGHDGKWIAGFTHFENGGDALFAELRAIQLGIATCYDIGYTHVICECDCLEAIDLILNVTNVSLHVYASVLLEISDALHQGLSI
jgi:predicted amidohydrolase